MPLDDFDGWRARHGALFEALYERSGACELGVTLGAFEKAVSRVVSALARSGVVSSEWGSRLNALHVGDLALATACLEGQARGWEALVDRHRADLIKAGRAMAGDEGVELAESLLGDLWGVDEKGRVRRSPLESFQGRARLGTWLRTVLAQRHVDRWRRQRREEPVDAHAALLLDESHRGAEARVDRERLLAALQRAMDAALAGLVPVDRARVALYYGQGLNLAEIGRLLREHEATVSRKLARIRKDIEQAVRAHLVDVEGMSPRALADALDVLRERDGIDLGRWLVEDEAERA